LTSTSLENLALLPTCQCLLQQLLKFGIGILATLPKPISSNYSMVNMVCGVTSMIILKFSFYVDCIKGQHNCQPFPKEDGIQTFELLGMVHFGICGPLLSTTHLGYKCFLTLINDFFLYSMVYFLQ
jgi:hypothetical protein